MPDWIKKTLVVDHVLIVSGLTCFLSSLCDKITAKRRRLKMQVRTHPAKRAFEIEVEPPVQFLQFVQ